MRPRKVPHTDTYTVVLKDGTVYTVQADFFVRNPECVYFRHGEEVVAVFTNAECIYKDKSCQQING